MGTKKQPTKSEVNRVWIELEKPRDKAHAEQICELANRLIERLSRDGVATERKFFWSEREWQFCYGGDMGYSTQVDRGIWLNLDYLGRPLEPVKR